MNQTPKTKSTDLTDVGIIVGLLVSTAMGIYAAVQAANLVAVPVQ